MVKFDNSLIYLVSENARMRIKEISGHLEKSSPRLKYNIYVAQKEGVIRDPHTVFDYSYFGLILFKVYFKGGYIDEHDKGRIMAELQKNPYIIAIYELEGEYDLVIEFASPNPSRFNKELKKLASLKPTLNKYKIVLNLVSYLYPRQFLSSLQTNVESIIGGDRGIVQFEENEKQVIKALLAEPTGRLRGLSKIADVNVKTVKKIMANLESRKIILGYKRMIDSEKLGLKRYRLFLRLHNLSQEKEKEITEHMLATKEVIVLNKTVGDWDMEVDIESSDRSRIRAITMQIRQEWQGVIEGFNLMEFFGYYKRSYLPEFLFE
jgi:Lrp/AsnC family leucine-responsive transcriptional regulator